MKFIVALGELHDKAGRLLVTVLSLGLLGLDMFVKGKTIDATSLTVVAGLYIGGASVAKVAQSVTVKRTEKKAR